MNQRPEIVVSPQGGTFLDAQQHYVTITWRDLSLDVSTRQIKVNGSDPPTSWSHAVVNAFTWTSSGAVPLSASGPTTLWARAVQQRGSDRARGWDQPLCVRRQQPAELCRSVWSPP